VIPLLSLFLFFRALLPVETRATRAQSLNTQNPNEEREKRQGGAEPGVSLKLE
jgi:hypothetical protein